MSDKKNKYNISPELRLQFKESFLTNLSAFEKMILNLEQNLGDKESLNGAFRAIHQIKGESDYIGYGDVNKLTHESEGLLDLLRLEQIKPDTTILSLLFDVHDKLKSISEVMGENYEEQNVDAIIAEIHYYTKEDTELPAAKSSRKTDLRSIFNNSAEQTIEYVSELLTSVAEGESSKGIKAKIIRSLKSLHNSARYAKITEIYTLVQNIMNDINKKRYISKNDAGKILSDLKKLSSLLQVNEKDEKNENETGLQSQSNQISIDKNIKLNIDKIDGFMNNISELNIQKNRLTFLLKSSKNNKDNEILLTELLLVNDKITKICENLTNNITDIRLVNINVLFNRLYRVVRDISTRTGKKIKLSIIESNIELDHKVMDYLIGPVVQIIRNAVVHGIEKPAARKIAGKSETGSILIKTERIDNNLVLEIADDGRGIDVEKIKSIVKEKQYLKEEEINHLNDNEALGLIFIPGFTSIKNADKNSGRGVGLDIVKNNLKAIGGNVNIKTEPGKATKFRLEVPVEIITTEVLMTDVNGEKYAFPLNNIKESLIIDTKDIRKINGIRVLKLSGKLIRLDFLSDLLKINTTNKNKTFKAHVLILEFGNLQKAVAVDKLTGKYSIIIKKLDNQLSNLQEYSGATVLGDGSIALVINIIELFNLNNE